MLDQHNERKAVRSFSGQKGFFDTSISNTRDFLQAYGVVSWKKPVRLACMNVATFLGHAHCGGTVEHDYQTNKKYYIAIFVQQKLPNNIEMLFLAGAFAFPSLANDRKAPGEVTCTQLPKRLPREEMENHYAVS